MDDRGDKSAPVASEEPGPQVMCTPTAGLGCESPRLAVLYTLSKWLRCRIQSPVASTGGLRVPKASLAFCLYGDGVSIS